MNATEFNRQLLTRRKEAETELRNLERVYEKLLGRVAKDALAAFAQQTVTAAAWQPPPEGNLFDLTATVAYARQQISRLHRRVFSAIAGPPIARAGISFDVTNPLVTNLLDQAGQRVGVALGEAATPIIQETLIVAYEQGMSVDQAADLLQEKLRDATPAQARMLARTDLNGLANGASVMAARTVGVQYKTWLTAEDDRVRPEHVEADGQTVPVDQPFQVCGEELDFPGDPAGSDECTANCRCTVIYADPDGLIASANGDGYLSVPKDTMTLRIPKPQVHIQPVPIVDAKVIALLERTLTAAATPEAADAIAQLGDILERLNQTIRALEQPRLRRVNVRRDEAGDIVSMTITEER